MSCKPCGFTSTQKSLFRTVIDIKDILLICLPEIETNLEDEDQVCLQCYNFLQSVQIFREKCLLNVKTLAENVREGKSPDKSKDTKNESKKSEDIEEVELHSLHSELLGLLESSINVNPHCEVIEIEDEDESVENKESSVSDQPPPRKKKKLDDVVKCNLCPYMTAFQFMPGHVKMKHNYSCCRRCLWTTDNEEKLIVHIRDIHKEQKTQNLKCKSCGFESCYCSIYNEHPCVDKFKKICGVCSRDFSSNSHLKCHYTFKHPEECYNCEKCDKYFYYKFDLMFHKKNGHIV